MKQISTEDELEVRRTEMSHARQRCGIKYLGQTLLLALVYMIAGWLCIRFAIASKYATPIFAPAGLALAVVLRFGGRFVPGVWLGSFLMNVLIAAGDGRDFGLVSSWAIMVTMAGGSALAAFVSAALIRRFTKYPKFTDRIRQIVLVQFIGAPVGAMIAATVGCVSLLGAGLISFDQLFFSLFSWWIGDAVGVLLILPIMLAVFSWMEDRRRPHRWLLHVGPYALTFAVVSGVFVYAGRAEERRLTERFTQHADAAEFAIRKVFDLNAELLGGVESFYRSSERVTQDEFRQFVSRSLERNEGVRMLAWAPKVPANELSTFDGEGVEGFRLKTFNPSDSGVLPVKPSYYPICYVEPAGRNQALFGLDLGSESIIEEALLRAVQTGALAMTAPIALMGERAGRSGVLAILPIYRNGRPQEEAHLQGFVIGSFDVEVIVDEALSVSESEAQVAVGIYDLGAGVGGQLLVEAPVSAGDQVRYANVAMLGRHWRLVMYPSSNYYVSSGDHRAWLLFGGGLLFAWLASCFLQSTAGHSARTERMIGERTKALIAANQNLQRSNQNLQEFAHVASHDLREPLRTVTSFLELLEAEYSEALDDEARKYIRFCVEGAERMKGLIVALLDFSRVATHGAPFDLCDFNELFGVVRQSLSKAIDDAGVVITQDTLPSLYCDRVQIEQLFQNLLINSIKYSGEVSPEIHLGAKLSKGIWLISVRDNGEGISEKHFERVFQIFQRLSPQGEVAGTGIGLAICKRIVERHGGEIWVESTIGEGATFFFTLSVDRKAAETNPGIGIT